MIVHILEHPLLPLPLLGFVCYNTPRHDKIKPLSSPPGWDFNLTSALAPLLRELRQALVYLVYSFLYFK
ncbi:MAG: hypothetical protein PWP51_771 [Clostridiales bacterium]|jgi:hypothetical protein|nr:hypothetical protein [Clostridiales bacterium]MDN5298218.1 hypothetical protein [Clostridiales bacterium]